ISLRALIGVGILATWAIPRLRTVWADLVRREGWWTSAKQRLEVEKLQLEIAILRVDAAGKGIEPISPLTAPSQDRKGLTVDRLFLRQLLAAWLGGMMPLVFL